MKLIYDEFDSEWIWVDDYDENIEFSPRFDDQESAEKWRNAVAKELDKDVGNLYNGASIVLPRNKEHAENMLRVASFYLNQLGYGPK
jgi:hypothetical protein